MNRIFLGLAAANMSTLTASLVVGFVSAAEGGPGTVGHRVHLLLGFATVLMALLVHSIAYTYFLGTGKWVKEVVRVYAMPTWIEAQSKKNKRKAFPFEFWSMMAVGATAWTGAGSDARGWPLWWHLLVASGTWGFNLAAHAAEYRAIVAQARLILEVKDRADRMRIERYGPEPVAATEPA